MYDLRALLLLLLIGLAAGWIAGKLMLKGRGLHPAAAITVGVVGAFLGDWLLRTLGVHLPWGLLGRLAAATLGASLLLLPLRVIR